MTKQFTGKLLPDDSLNDNLNHTLLKLPNTPSVDSSVTPDRRSDFPGKDTVRKIMLPQRHFEKSRNRSEPTHPESRLLI